MITGLTLGKFAPFHKGHQHLIETALKEVDKLIVVIYGCHETTKVPLSTRAQWIRNLYPSVEVIEAPNGPADIGDTPEIRAKQEGFILGLLNGRKVNKFYSSEFYGDHMSKALHAENRVVDENRTIVPISGTEIRKDSYSNRSFIHPMVYKDLVSNVVLMGAPSTGKSTLAEALAKKYNTCWMPEYGREYWDKHQVDRRLTKKQLAELAKGHIEREDALLLKANRYLFTDTNAITTLLFSYYYHGKADAELAQIVYNIMGLGFNHVPKLIFPPNTPVFAIYQPPPRYQVYLLCNTDIPYDNTWDRSGAGNRRKIQKMTIDILKSFKVKYHIMSGSIEERVKKAEAVLCSVG